MIDTLIKQFAGSGAAQEAISALTAQGLSSADAQGAVAATAEGATQALQGEGGLANAVGGLLGGGGGGMANALGGLLGGAGGGTASLLGGAGGGGGLGGILGGLTGGAGDLPPAVVDSVAQFVSTKTGLSIDHARMAANVVLPKVIAFVKSKMA